MKRIGSVMMAEAKPLLWKLLLAFLIIGAVQLGLFLDGFRDTGLDFGDLIKTTGVGGGFRFGIVVACLLMAVQSCRASDLMLRRLPLGEYAVTGLWALVHLAYLILFWAFQLALLYGLWQIYCAYGLPASGWNLELVLACYTEPILHGIFPLEDAAIHCRNAVWLLSLAAETAMFGWFYRRGRKRPVELMILLTMGIGCLALELESFAGAMIQIGVCLVTVGTTVFGMWEVRSHEAD